MRRIVLTTILAVALGAVMTTAASAAGPRLAIATGSSLVVTGTHFAPRELVTVTFGPEVRHVRTTALGSFRAGFDGVAYDRCSGMRIAAAGVRGDRAVLLRARALCAPLSSP